MSDPGSLCFLEHMLSSLVDKGQGFFEGSWLYTLGSKEAITSGYHGPLVTVFLNRAFLLFSAPDTENCGSKSREDRVPGLQDSLWKLNGCCFQA